MADLVDVACEVYQKAYPPLRGVVVSKERMRAALRAAIERHQQKYAPHRSHVLDEMLRAVGASNPAEDAPPSAPRASAMHLHGAP